MYTLYYAPGKCSLIIHCLLEELGADFELKLVDVASGEHRGADFRKLNPKSKVPTLATPDGILTESVALIEYLCDRHEAGASLLGKPGSWLRATTMERIATLATEVIPLCNRFFHDDDFSDSDDVRRSVKAHGAGKLVAWFREQDAALTRPYWSGNAMTAADLYFMVLARWGRWLEPSSLRMKNIEAFFTRMTERPAVKRAMEREGIKPFGD